MATHDCKADDCTETFARIADLRKHSKEVHGVDLSPRANAVAPGGEAEEGSAPPEATVTEIVPGSDAPAKPTLGEKLKGALASKPKADKPAKPKGRKGARISTASGFSAVYRRIGDLLINSGVDAPVGRALVYQSPRAGDIFDRAIADTFVDKAIQPLAKKGEAIAEVASLAMMPVLVGMYERTGSPAIEQMLRVVMVEHLEAMLPIIKAQREVEARHAQLVRDMGLDPGDDAIGAVLREMFAPPSGAESPDGPGDGLEEATFPGPDGARAAAV